MKKIVKDKILGLILPLIMVFAIFVPSAKANDVETYTIRLLLETEKLNVENKDNYDIAPSKRQVIYYRLKDGVEFNEDKKINVVNDIYDLDQKGTEAYLKKAEFWDSEGTLSSESKFDTKTNPDGTIPGKDFKLSLGNEDGIKEVIEITGLKAGTYLIKESDQSIKNHSIKKITPKIIKVPGEDKKKPVIEILNKEKIPNPKTTVRLEKVDDKDENIKLEGAEFYLYRVSGDKREGIIIDENTAKIGKYTFSKYGDNKAASVLKTDEKGMIEVGNLDKLPDDTYHYLFVEKAQPIGYDVVQDVKEKVKPGETVKVKNHITPFLKKIRSDNEKPLEGVVFNLYRKKDDSIVKFTKDKKGYIEDEKGKADLVTDKEGLIKILKIEDGTYYFKEKEALKGFEILTEKTQDIKVKNSRYVNDKDEPMILIVKNKPETPNPETFIGGYNFIKTDNSKEAKRLQGAKFKVQVRENGTLKDLNIDRKPLKDTSEKIYIVTSDKDGKISVDGLPYTGAGTEYYLKEVGAPEGFVPNSSATPFTVNAASKDQQPIQIENHPNVTITTEKPTTKITRNTVTTDYTPTGVTKIIRGPIVKTGDIRILIMAVIGLILLITGVKLVRSAEKPRIA